MNKISILENKVQDYDWGSRTFIPDLIGVSNPDNKPQAELWMGAHPKAPSKIRVEDRSVSLLEMIEKHPRDILGPEVAEKFNNQLPYLFKVLAAVKPLSIQAHPNLTQARIGFEYENKLKIPQDASCRNYKDPNHKPECICALTRFTALCGFRDIPEILARMQIVCPRGLNSELDILRTYQNALGLKCFFAALMTMDASRAEKLVDTALEQADILADKDAAYQWMLALSNEYPGDVGILAPILLNLIELQPGEALYLPAGELHAYLEGAGMELMANSDNVLRGGLTSKYLDVGELLKILNFNPRQINILELEATTESERVYPSPADEFVLSVITVKSDTPYQSPRSQTVEVLLCTQGEAEFADHGGEEILRVQKGTSVLIPAVADNYRISGDAIFYKAAVPI